jgi:hypothetical protein
VNSDQEKAASGRDWIGDAFVVVFLLMWVIGFPVGLALV